MIILRIPETKTTLVQTLQKSPTNSNNDNDSNQEKKKRSGNYNTKYIRNEKDIVSNSSKIANQATNHQKWQSFYTNLLSTVP